MTQQDAIMAALTAIAAPGGGSLAALVTGLAVRATPDGAQVSFALNVAPSMAETYEPLRQEAVRRVGALAGVARVTAVLTAEKPAPGSPQSGSAGEDGRLLLPQVRAIIAVASGKGGVGKSTTAVNLAIAAAGNGLRVGLLDADIYGPSVPRLLAISQKPESRDGKILLPIEKYGLQVMSMGFLVPEDTPMIWRGPMVQSALQQMLRDVAWGDLDILFVDMPPGTGDAQLTMAQRVPLAGAVIVSTPQDIALIDARKGLAMFQRVRVPVLGIIENMSYFCCPSCGTRSEIFGHGGAAAEAARLGVPLLGAVPLEIQIRTTSDAGTPITHQAPDAPASQLYRQMAEQIWQQVGTPAGAPRLLMLD